MKTNTFTNIIKPVLSITYILPAVLILLLTSVVITSRTLSIKPAATTTPAVHITSPAANASLSGTITLSAALSDHPANTYDMFWYVDNGSWNWMDSTVTGDAKAATINLASWTWHGSNTEYVIVVVAVMHNTGQRAYSGVPIHIVPAATTVAAQPEPAIQTPTVTVPTHFYVDPSSNAAAAAASTTDATTKRVMTRLAQAPVAAWFGNWNTDVQGDVNALVNAAAAAAQTPLLVFYNIPNRDCGGYSSGGATSPDSYKRWITSAAAGIGNRNAVVILEPDATAETECLSPSDLATRTQLLSFAITTLKHNPAAKVYLDAGNPTWMSAADMAARLQAAGLAAADGFSLNVSNFYPTSDNITYGTAIAKLTNNKHFVIDTSRNGNGSNGEWCNPAGRALGAVPTSTTNNLLVDYFLWVKAPGESDGTCNGGPAAGIWWPAYALSLALNAGW